jgi:DNA end-binding protein Ku
MAATGTVGISRLVLYRCERAVMLEPRERGIVVWTLRYGDEVRDQRNYFAEIKAERPEAKLVSLIARLIDEKTVGWDPKLLRDPVEEKLRDLIAARKSGGKPAKAKTMPKPAGNVVNIMEALRKSLAADRKPAKTR